MKPLSISSTLLRFRRAPVCFNSSQQLWPGIRLAWHEVALSHISLVDVPVQQKDHSPWSATSSTHQLSTAEGLGQRQLENPNDET